VIIVENMVAGVLKGLGGIVGIISLIAAMVVGSDIGFVAGLGVFLIYTISALLLYAFGEVISLLQDIKNNTQPAELPHQRSANGSKTVGADELPEL
jgi:hypothetical protein